MDIEAEILSRTTPRRVPPAGLRYDFVNRLAETFYRDLDPESDVAIDPRRLVDLAIREETALISGWVKGLERVALVGVNAGWPAFRLAPSVRDFLLLVHPDLDQVKLAKRLLDEKWTSESVRVVSGKALELPLKDESVDGVISDCGLASWEASDRIVSECLRVLRPDGRLVAREVNWEFELQGKSLVEEQSFKRYGGKIYYGYTKRTLDPPREVEYICLLDQANLWVQNLRSLPREELRRVPPEDRPGLGDLLISAEYFEIHQMTERSLVRLLTDRGFSDVRVTGSAFERAVEEHYSRLRETLGAKGHSDLAESLIRRWETLVRDRKPFLFATARKTQSG